MTAWLCRAWCGRVETSTIFARSRLCVFTRLEFYMGASDGQLPAAYGRVGGERSGDARAHFVDRLNRAVVR